MAAVNGSEKYRTGQTNAKGKVICGGKRRTRPAACQQTILGPNGRCRIHNGYAAKGRASSGFTHGRYSKAIPDRLAARYEEASNDPQLLEQRAELALIDARMGDLLEQVGAGSNMERWQQLVAVEQRLTTAQAGGDEAKITQSLAQLRGLVREGHQEQENWREIYGLIEQRRRVAESEAKREVAMDQMATVEQILLLFGQLGMIALKHFGELPGYGKYTNDVDRLVNSGTEQLPTSVGRR